MKSIKEKIIFAFALLCYSFADAQTQTIEGLTVIVKFADSPAIVSPSGNITSFTDTQIKNIYKLVNRQGYNGPMNVGSLKDYYLDNSRGKLHLNNQVVVVHLPNPRSSYLGPDEFGAGKAKRPGTNVHNTVLTLTGGSLFRLKEDVLCRLVGGGACGGISYKVVTDSAPEPIIGPTVTSAFNMQSLSKVQQVFHMDWLDHVHLTGIQQLVPTVISRYSFIQIIAPGNRGSRGRDFWPRSIPSLDTGRIGLNDTAIGRMQLVPVPDANNPSAGYMFHETAHTLYNLLDHYDAQQAPHRAVPVASTESQILSILVGQLQPPESFLICEPSPGLCNYPSFYLSHAVADYGLMGLVTDSHANPPLISAQQRELAGWETPRDLIDAGEGEVYTVDWHADGSNPNVARSFKYCKPDSNLDECFYIEARHSSWHRDSRNGSRKVFSPANGLMVWHAEHYDNPLDFYVNQRKEGTPGLHFDVSLVQADGARELELTPKASPVSTVGKLFDPATHNKFDDFTPAKSRWWDNSPSGLALRNIQYGATSETMSFEIGKRPKRPVFIDFDPADFSIEINGISKSLPGASVVPVGNFSLKITPKKSGSYRVTHGGDKTSTVSASLTGIQTVTARNLYRENIIRIARTLSGTNTLQADFRLDEGAKAQWLETLLTSEGTAEPYTPVTSFPPFPRAVGQTFKSSTYEWARPRPSTDDILWLNGSTNIFLSAHPGFRLKGWSVDYRDGYIASGSSETVTLDKTKLAAQTEGMPFIIRVKAERIPGLLCSAGVVEPWKWDGEYSDVGTLVRWQDDIYSANVPRATVYANRLFFAGGFTSPYINLADISGSYTSSVGQNQLGTFNHIARCGGYSESCTGVPAWAPEAVYNQGEEVVHNGQLWAARWDRLGLNTDASNVVYRRTGRRFIYPGQIAPGSDSSFWLGFIPTISTSTENANSLGVASILEGRPEVAPMWELKGNCGEASNIHRGYLRAFDGVTALTFRGQGKPGDFYWEKSSASSDTFTFKLESGGYLLDGVFVDGVQVGVGGPVSGVYSFTHSYASRSTPAYIEVRTKK